MTDQLGHEVAVVFDGMLVGFTDPTFLSSLNCAMEEVQREIGPGGEKMSIDGFTLAI